MERFTVLRDVVKDFHVDGSSVSSFEVGTPGTFHSVGVIQQISIDEFISLKGKETIFSGVPEPMTNSAISSGALYVCFRAHSETARSGTIPENKVYIIPGGACRLRYYDA